MTPRIAWWGTCNEPKASFQHTGIIMEKPRQCGVCKNKKKLGDDLLASKLRPATYGFRARWQIPTP